MVDKSNKSDDAVKNAELKEPVLKFEPKKSEIIIKDNASDIDILDAVLEKKQGDFLPWDDVILPSKGLYYDNAIPGGIVKVRPMGINVHKIISTQRLAQSGKSIEYVLKDCIELPNNFDYADLLSGDVTFLFYYIRGITHGNMYEFVTECSNKACRVAREYEYDLNDLVSTITYGNPDLGSEPFKVVLPHLSKMVGKEFWVKVRFRRHRDINTMTNQIKERKKVLGSEQARRKKIKRGEDGGVEITLDETLDRNLGDMIVEVMGDNNKDKIKGLIERLHSSDVARISKFLTDNEPGMDTSIKIDCEECGNAMTINMPITVSFFRPS